MAADLASIIVAWAAFYEHDTIAVLAAALMLLATATGLAGEKVEFLPAAEFGKLPAGWTLGNCSAVAISKQDEVYLFHRGQHPILCFDTGGELSALWGDDVIQTAHGLRVDRDDNVWATDIGGHRVYKFDPTGKVLLALGTGQPGAGTDQFNQPTDIAFGPDGEFFVSDGYGNSRVLKFSPSGGYLGIVGHGGPAAWRI